MKGNGRSRVCLGLLRETASDRPNTHTHTSLSLFFPPACSVLQGRPFAAEEGEEKEIYLRRDTFQHERRRTEEGREIYPRAHCSRRTFPPKGKARNSETIEKLDLTVERGGSRRCTFAAANCTPSSSLISFLSRRRFPELHSELLFNQGSGVRCFLLPTIGFLYPLCARIRRPHLRDSSILHARPKG